MNIAEVACLARSLVSVKVGPLIYGIQIGGRNIRNLCTDCMFGKEFLMTSKTLSRSPITYKEVQQLTGLPIGTLYSLVSRKQIPHIRMGKRSVRFIQKDVESWMQSVNPAFTTGRSDG